MDAVALGAFQPREGCDFHMADSTKADRPEPVPDNFKLVSDGDTGYAVLEHSLWVGVVDDGITEGEEYTEAMLKLSTAGVGMADVALVIYRAVTSYDGVPSVLREMQDRGWVRGDVSDFESLIEALEYYEKHEASIGEDKFAYDMRTALNHALPAIKDRVGE